MIVLFIVFFSSTNLICRGRDISKCFRESLRDNEIVFRSDSYHHALEMPFPGSCLSRLKFYFGKLQTLLTLPIIPYYSSFYDKM